MSEAQKHDQALVNRLHAKPQPSDPTEKQEKPLMRLESLSDENKTATMLRFWTRMRGMFGASWVREHGDIDGEQVAVWMDGLGGLTLDQVKNGIEQAAKWQEKFPPNLPQFMKLCLTTRREGVKPENQKYLESEKTPRMPPEVVEVWQAVLESSTKRDISFALDYDKLCRQHMGPLSKDKDQLYRSKR